MISFHDGTWSTLFAYRLDRALDWPALVGGERLASALAGPSAVAAAIPAGRWSPEVAYAALAVIEPDADGPSLLCALRRRIPFDAVEIAGVHAAARLLATSIEDGRKLAVAERAGAARLVQRSVRHELERARDSAALSRAAALIAASIDANGASIMLVDGAELHLRASVGLPQAMLGHRQRIGEGIAGYVAQSGEPMELQGSVQDARFTGTDPDAGSALVIPLRVADRVIGVLNVKRAAGGEAFDELERALATDLADELARAVSPAGATAPADPASVADGGQAWSADAPGRSSPTGGASPTVQPVGPERAGARAALRILAVEDHPLMRIGITTLLGRAGLALAALSATATEAVEQARGGGLDVALVDLGLPDADGVDVVERIHAAAPHLPIVAFSADGSSDRVRAAIRAGAIGYLSKGTPSERIVAALQAAAAGLSALGPEEAAALAEPHDAVGLVQKAVARSLPPAFESAPEAPAAPRSERVSERPGRDTLSARELELLKYLAEGYTNKEIARAMVLAEDTVKKAVQTLIAKLGATDRTHAVVLALRSDLIQ